MTEKPISKSEYEVRSLISTLDARDAPKIEKALEHLSRRLIEPNPVIEFTAAEELIKIGPPALNYLQKSLERKDKSAQERIKKLVDEIKYIYRAQGAKKSSKEIPKDKYWGLWLDAEEALDKLVRPAVDISDIPTDGEQKEIYRNKIGIIIEINANVRKIGMEKLLNIGKPALDLMVEQLKDKEVDFRRVATRVLGEFTDKSPMKPLIHALEDEDLFVRKNAADALVKICCRA